MQKEESRGKHIFISYIDEDKNIAEQVWDRLEVEGFIPWAYTRNDTNRWKRAIVRELKRADIIILIFSKKTNEKADKQIIKELGLASEFGKELIPFMVDDIKPDDITNEEIAYEIIGGNITWINKDNPLEKQVDRLLERIRRYYGINAPESNTMDKVSGKKERKSNLFWIFLLLTIVLLLIGFSILKSNQNTEIPPLQVSSEVNKTETDPKVVKVPELSHPSEFGVEDNGTLPIKNDINDTVPPKTKEPISESIVNPNDMHITIKNFLEAFYRDSQLPSPLPVLKYYNDYVNYFGKKNADKEYILKNSRAYIKKYPKRKYMITAIDIKNKNSEKIVVNVTYKWEAESSHGEKKAGDGVQEYRLAKKAGQIYICYIDTISRNERKAKANHAKIDGSKNNLFVCYKDSIVQEGQLTYIGCLQENMPCASNLLRHFGKYATEGASQKALTRCINGVPKSQYEGTVSVPDNDFLALRSEPHSDAQLIEKLHNDDRFGVIEQRGKWIKVIVKKNGSNGWVYSAYIRRLPPYDAIVYGLKNYLALQKNPSKNANTIAKLHNGDILVVLEEKGKWAKVKDKRSKMEGWAHRSKIKPVPKPHQD